MMNLNTRERIKDRILKRAAKIWGYPEAEAETSFDPLVGLLLNSCAAELESIYGEIKASNARLLDRLLEVMTIENSGSVLPARTVMHAMPVESNFTLQLTNQFYINHQIPNKYEPENPINKRIFFGPTGNFNLVNASVKYTALDNKLYEVVNFQNKTVLTHARPNKSLKPSNLWIGILVDKKVKRLENPMFYFHVRNEDHKKIFYHYLKQLYVSVNNNPIKLHQGYNTIENKKFDINSIINDNHEAMSKIYAQVNAFFNHKFITLDEKIDLNKYHQEKKNSFPLEFEGIFEGKALENLEDEIVWFKFQFPPTLVDEVTEDVQIALNCFPAINKQLESVNQKVSRFLNIIPLASDNSFLDVKDIYDTEGTRYNQKSFNGTEEPNENIAIIRKDSVGRFDSRSASELVQHLLETLKDESASYSAMGGDLLTSEVRKLNQLIANLEQMVDKSQLEKNGIPYIMLNLSQREQNPTKSIFAEYWTTNGVFANNIKAGINFKPDTGVELQEKTILNMLTTLGGRENPNVEERIYAHRETILSRNRVVTIQDIKALCYKHFGKALEKVEVKRGIMATPFSSTGFTKTIDILLYAPSKENGTVSREEWQFLCEDLKIQLKERAS
ncbi:type VI secretion system baseplate subunit TssF, partial [Xanthovirga aplysinae]|uniref:type VI secretion system baseplate subunit TssF n=1 Tax=Xanthovirga aplysinae TaxID=2529853 RepID=UPI0012BCA7C6